VRVVTGTPLRRVARTLLVLTALTAVVFVATQRAAMADALRECGRLDRSALLLAIGLTIVGVVNRGLQTRRAYAGAGLDIDTATATALAATAYCGNKVTKAGGIVGLATHLHDARRRSLDPTRTVAAYVVITMSGGAGAFVLAAGVLAMASLPSLIGAVLIGAVGVAVTGRTLRSTAPRLFVARNAKRVANRFGTSVDVDDVGHACRSIGRARAHLAWVVAHAVVGKLLGAVLLHVVLQGFGVTSLDVETTVRLYALALVAAALGPLPAGIGTTEASLAGLLVATNVDSTTAVAAAMAFRMFDLWLPVAIGAATAPFVLRSRRSTTGGRDQTLASGIMLPGEVESSTFAIMSVSHSSPLRRR
jgi:uncharacterized membrane protein YbhN (UPF0104 family)